MTGILAGAAPGAYAATAATPPSAFDFDAVLTTDTLSDVQGGLKQGTRTIANLDLTSAWKGQDGWESFVYVEVTHGGGFSDQYSGDTQFVSNIDLPAGIHLSEGWVRKTSRGGHFVSTLGFNNVNNMFDVQDVGALFLNTSHGIAIEFGQSGASGKPICAFGFTQEWRPRADIHVRGGLFDAVAGDPEHGSVFATAYYSSRTGLQYQVEMQKDFAGGFVKLGHWGNTAPSDPLDGVGAPGRYSGTYGQLSATLSQEADGPEQGLKGWVRVGNADARLLAFDRYVGGGLVYTGPFRGRDHDQAGIALASGRYGKSYRATATEPVTTESSYEASYQYEVKPGLVLQPDLQYVEHPSGLSSVKDAVVVTLRVRVGIDALRSPG